MPPNARISGMHAIVIRRHAFSECPLSAHERSLSICEAFVASRLFCAINNCALPKRHSHVGEGVHVDCWITTQNDEIGIESWCHLP